LLACNEGAEITYDCIGVGAFAGSHFAALNEDDDLGRAEYHKFNAAGEVLRPDDRMNPNDPKSPKNKDFYENAKAQAWWEVSRRFLNTYNAVTKGMEYDDGDLISISSDMPLRAKLINELATPRKSTSKKGKSMVESKSDLAKRDIDSPNLADAFIMAFCDNGKRDIGPMYFMA